MVKDPVSRLTRQCFARATKDDLCNRHQPEAVAKRQSRADDAYANSAPVTLIRTQKRLNEAIRLLRLGEWDSSGECWRCRGRQPDHAERCELHAFLKEAK